MIISKKTARLVISIFIHFVELENKCIPKVTWQCDSNKWRKEQGDFGNPSSCRTKRTKCTGKIFTMWVHCQTTADYLLEFLETLKANIHVHQATANVALCMVVICHVVCCQQHVATIKPLFYSWQHVAGNSCKQQCCLQYVGLDTA